MKTRHQMMMRGEWEMLLGSLRWVIAMVVIAMVCLIAFASGCDDSPRTIQGRNTVDTVFIDCEDDTVWIEGEDCDDGDDDD